VKLAPLIMIAACGRIGFDPNGGAGPPSDGRPPNDGSGSQPIDARPIDAPPTVCQTMSVPVTAGVVAQVNTCGGTDAIDGCGPAMTQELLLAFTPAASGGYNARAYDRGTQNITTSTSVMDAACSGHGGCAGLLGLQYQQGVTYYFVLEAPAGGCKDVDFLVD
jgi:hypothetical protein